MSGITVLLYRQTRYFGCCVVKQLPDFLLIYFSKTFNHFVFTILIGYEVIAY